jgi:hypothetical protein
MGDRIKKRGFVLGFIGVFAGLRGWILGTLCRYYVKCKNSYDIVNTVLTRPPRAGDD